MRHQRSMTRRRAALLGGALLALGSCGGQVETTSNTSGEPRVDQSSDGGTGFLENSVEARWNTTFSGVRRVKLDYTQPGVEYREAVGADGQGSFAIETIEVLTAHPDPDVFLAPWLRNPIEGVQNLGGFAAPSGIDPITPFEHHARQSRA